MTCVGDQTNSTDPAAVNPRIFVGNLNTHVVSKEDVERLFKRCGRIIGLSKHKGYAFVQYTDAYDARNALGSPVKRARTEPLAFRPASAISGGNKGVANKKLRTYAEPDILICGNCREVFPSLQKLLDYKRHRCRLCFTCRCHVVRLFPAESSPVIQLPVCIQCLALCGSWWELTCHFEDTY
ncbi:heterogeneous nuclear ribonucleoprotein C-like 2 [Rhipicephalus microplus]|uniref:heterogeneous nuclear ribonucleoprotein C-like 2 n=1 Tax=Rhipicephalus microplus TaxID=6941 RepID=UPI003F6CE1D0